MNFFIENLKNLNPYNNLKSIHTNIKNDIIAGIVVAIIALPLALAFGEMSGLGPIAGILGAVAGGIFGGLFGGSIVSISGPTAPTASQIAALMILFISHQNNQPDIVAIFSIIFLSGLIMVIFSISNFSKYVHFIPYSVVAGFMCGIGLIVILSQINIFAINQLENDVLYVAIPCLIIMLLWNKIRQYITVFKNIPAPIITLFVGTIIAYFMNLNIPYIGDKMINNDSQEFFHLYIPDFKRLLDFLGPAAALAGLVIIDSLLTCLIADNLTSSKHSSSREIFGQGVANMASGLIGGVSTATATMFTVSNIKFGGKTPLSSIIYGITLLIILLGLKSLVSIIPIACIAAILIKVGIDILDYRVVPILQRLPLLDLFVFLIVMLITIFYNLIFAVIIGVILSVIGSIKFIRSKKNHRIISILDYYDIDDDQKIKLDNLKIKILQPRGALFFGSIQSLVETYNNITDYDILILDMNEISDIDLSGVYALEDIIKKLKNKNQKFFIFNTNSKIKKVIDNLNFIQNIGSDNFYNSKEIIISKILN